MSQSRWHHAGGWLPVPLFVLALLGEDRCRALSESLLAQSLPRVFFVGFALEHEHHQTSIETISDLDGALVRITSPDYCFDPARVVMRRSLDADWKRECDAREVSQEAALKIALATPGSPEALEVALLEKQLPSGRTENIALMRKILRGEG